ncbi:hypothetical protein [Pseudomonas sp. LS-2]|uniref:hypothetical protein n=1 Tax=Pseudomonas sp. LS-2 TaxID=2315859 RepID=UPI000E760E16|nr:hypothetical protein [Pseudomonas sp. LS-2]RJX72652.1 hypothetical protein D3M70_31110 [Pseudomonas sp. LS-2]
MKKLEMLGEYLAHVLMGIAFFLMLALASLFLSLVTHWVGTLDAGKHLVPYLETIEMLIMIGDCVFVVWWLIFSTWKACKQI